VAPPVLTVRALGPVGARIEELLDEASVERELAALSGMDIEASSFGGPLSDMGSSPDMVLSETVPPTTSVDVGSPGIDGVIDADFLTAGTLSPPLPPFSDLDLGLDLDVLPEGDFGGDLGSLLPPSPAFAQSMELELGGGAGAGAGPAESTAPGHSGAIEVLGATEPEGLGNASSMALTEKNALFGGDNALSLGAVFPDGGSRFSPLKHYEMLHNQKNQSRRGRGRSTLSTPGPIRIAKGATRWGRGRATATPAAAEASSAIMPYNPATAPRVKREAAEDDFGVPALEYAGDADGESGAVGSGASDGWDLQQREKINLNPPKSMSTITDLELAYVDLKHLNTLMDKAGYSEEQKKQAKVRRRKVKNRHSAKGSATKKRTQYNSIAQTNKRLVDFVTELQSRNTRLASHNQELLEQTEEARRVAEEAVQEKEAFQREIDRLTALLGQMQADSAMGSYPASPSSVPSP